MKTPHISTLVACCLTAHCILTGFALAGSSTALSQRDVLDTRDTIPVINLIPALSDRVIDRDTKDERRLISFQSSVKALERPYGASAQRKEYYMQVKVPSYTVRGGGWGGQTGMGVYYGLELTAINIYANDSLVYKFEGDAPSANTPTPDWAPARFNEVINIPLTGGTYYFKVTLQGSPLYSQMKVGVRFKSARLCWAGGGPVAELDPAKPLWLVCHGKKDSERSMRSMNSALSRAMPGAQVVSVDWASGADEFALVSGRYFMNFGKNLAELLKDGGYTRKQVNWVGHSWGTLLGYETAAAFGTLDEATATSQVGFNRFIALDPATEAWNYDDGRVVFHKVSLSSTGVKGGDKDNGPYGSERKAITCDFAIRLFSEKNDRDRIPFSSGFYHSLPRDWFVKSVNKSKTDTFWPYFNQVVLRESPRPRIPWAKILPRGLSRFDIECYGETSSKADSVRFKNHNYLRYKAPSGRKWKAYRDSKFRWSVVND